MNISIDSLDLLKAAFLNNKHFRMTAYGESMLPFIQSGDVLTFAKIEGDTLSIGEVVACLRPETGQLLVHRIIAFKDSYYQIKGDNCRIPDGWLNQEEILGRLMTVKHTNKSIRFGTTNSRKLAAFLSRLHILKLLVSAGKFTLKLICFLPIKLRVLLLDEKSTKGNLQE